MSTLASVYGGNLGDTMPVPPAEPYKADLTVSDPVDVARKDKVRTYCAHLISSINNAYAGTSKLNSSHLSFEGMSAPRMRHFLNNLCSLPQARHLEVGVYMGSTFVASNVGNTTLDSVGIDNFSEFQNPGGRSVREILSGHIGRFFSAFDRERMKLIDGDAFQVPPSEVGMRNVYFYDGAHSAQAHYLSLKHFDSILSDVFILAVDNWDCALRGPHDGTLAAIKDLGYKLRYYEVCYFDDNHLGVPNLFAAVVEKP